MRFLVGYHRYDTAAELLLLNEMWQLQSKLTNYFYRQQKLVSKTRRGAKVSKNHDQATTPFHRTINHPSMSVERVVAAPRTGHKQGRPHPPQAQVNKRARSREATNTPSRAS